MDFEPGSLTVPWIGPVAVGAVQEVSVTGPVCRVECRRGESPADIRRVHQRIVMN
ncbi:hypothetical protein Lfu02_25850 [Longispora fulva]|nr:hypothetical protein Lfu02_25850 [Longispora fulva]